VKRYRIANYLQADYLQQQPTIFFLAGAFLAAFLVTFLATFFAGAFLAAFFATFLATVNSPLKSFLLACDTQY
jgi:hypothetical protein